MSEPTRGERTRKEIRRLKFLVSDLQKTIDRLEDLIESSDEESIADPNELQADSSSDDEAIPDPFDLQDGIHKGTIVLIAERSQKLLALGKYAEVLEVTSPILSLVQSQYSEPVSIANTEIQVTSVREALLHLEACAES